MANCRWKRQSRTFNGLGAPVQPNVRDTRIQFGPQASRERLREGQAIDAANLNDQAAKAWVEQKAREMELFDPLIRALAASRLPSRR